VVRGVSATLDNIERIPAPDIDTVDHKYVRQGRPVILTGLYEGSPAERLADPAVARAELGQVPLPVRLNPISELLQGRDPPIRTVGFADFYDQLAAGTAARELCIEHDVPEALAAYIPLPDYLELGEPADGWVSHMFMAGPCNVTHLHFDADKRNVLTYQLFGRKRYVVVDPAQTPKLAPGTPPAACFASALYLEHFSEADLQAFLRYVNAWDCVLEPGEVLFTPAGAWHYVEYVDVALSVTIRLSRNRYVRFLAESVEATSVELQALSTCFRDEDAVGPAEAEAFDELVAVANRVYPSSEARAAALDAVLVKLCDRLQLPVARAAYHLTDIERRARMASGVDSFAGMAPDACPPVRPWALASQEDARRGRRRARRLSRRW
jgi:Cupin-like domain